MDTNTILMSLLFLCGAIVVGKLLYTVQVKQVRADLAKAQNVVEQDKVE